MSGATISKMNLEALQNIKALVLDVDGVLTDGSILITEDGQLLRTMNIKDGYAMKRAMKCGLQIIVISGGTSEGVRIRLNKLGINEVMLGVENKITALTAILKEQNLAVSEIAVMGDDIPDLPMLEMAGLKFAPADAVNEVIEMADYISAKNGGQGCVREVIEMLLSARGVW